MFVAVVTVAVLLTGGIVTRDLFLVVAAFYVRYQSLPPPVSVIN